MKICFGENLKRLRKEKGLTQGEFSRFIGVSFQTVSKWERNETYPDITTLPRIAAFFGVTTDELLGTDNAQKEEKIAKYLEMYKNMQLKDVSLVLAKYEKAVKEFPNDYSLLINYMELLHIEKGSVRVQDYKPLSDKLSSAHEKIQSYCTDDGIRIRSKRIMLEHLMWQYQCLGWLDNERKFDERYRTQAENIFNTLPSMSDSKEYNLLCFDFDHREFDYAKWLENRRNAIEELSYLLQNVIIGYCYYDPAFSPEYKIDIITHMNGILQMLGKENKNAIHIIYNNGHLGHLYAEIGDNENALKHLRLAAEQAAEFDNLDGIAGRTALFYEREQNIRNKSMKERMYELMTKHYPLPPKLKSSAEFKKILTIIE